MLLRESNRCTTRESRHREEDNIEMDHHEVVWEIMCWIGLAEDRALVNVVIKIRFSYNARNFLVNQF